MNRSHGRAFIPGDGQRAVDLCGQRCGVQVFQILLRGAGDELRAAHAELGAGAG